MVSKSEKTSKRAKVTPRLRLWVCVSEDCATVYTNRPTKDKCISYKCRSKVHRYVSEELEKRALESTAQHWANCDCHLCEILDQLLEND